MDDDLDDQFIATRSLQKVMPRGATLNHTECGDDAIAYMIGEGPFADRERFPFPTLLITDLNMPNGDGLSVLAFMQHNPAWSVVPRIVFTSSTNEDDVRTAFFLGASAYHVKPDTLRQTEECLRGILQYWATSLVPPVDACGRVLVSVHAGARANRYPPPEASRVMLRPPIA